MDKRSSNIREADPEAIREAVAVLKRGGVVVFPTDTVYGVGARAGDPAAVARVFAAKRRPRDRPLPLLLARAADLSLVATGIPAVARRLADAFWPGGLTLVLRRAPSYQSDALAGDAVAVRVPDHPLVRELIDLLGEPLAATSANVSGRPSPTTAADAAAEIGDAVDLVIDGGPAPGGRESTVVDVTLDPPRILRDGAISRQAIAAVAGSVAGPADAAIE